MWHFPLLTRAKDSITALAKHASEAVVTASNTLYSGLTDAEVNKQRFNLAVSLVMDNPKAVQAAKDILSKVFLGFLMKLTPVASTLVGLAVELAYQAFKAAAESKAVPIRIVNVTNEIIWPNQTVEVVSPPTPIDPTGLESVVVASEFEQAEPGDTQ